MTSKVSLVKGSSRYNNILDAIYLIADDINLAGKKNILIKPNLTYTTKLFSTTHVDAVRAVLDYLQDRTDAKITIGEGVAYGDTFDAFEKLGYVSLAEKYKVKLADLNVDDYILTDALDRNYNPIKLRVSKKVVQSDFRISISPLKTHDCVIMTASLKNILAGSLLRDEPTDMIKNIQKYSMYIPAFLRQIPLVEDIKSFFSSQFPHSDKLALHQGYQVMNFNLFKLAKIIHPQLSIIDSFVGMEGAGPTDGSPVPLKCAVCSADFLAAETVAAKIMGLDIDEIGYLFYCKKCGLGEGNISKINVLGNSIEECSHKFRLHPYYKSQLNWKNLRLEKFL